MFIGGETDDRSSPNALPPTASNRRSIWCRSCSKSAKGDSNVGLEGQTRRTSMGIPPTLGGLALAAIDVDAKKLNRGFDLSRGRLRARSSRQVVSRGPWQTRL